MIKAYRKRLKRDHDNYVKGWQPREREEREQHLISQEHTVFLHSAVVSFQTHLLLSTYVTDSRTRGGAGGRTYHRDDAFG